MAVRRLKPTLPIERVILFDVKGRRVYRKAVVEERWLPRLWACLRYRWQGTEEAVSPCEEICSMGNLFNSVRLCQARAYAIVANGAFILTVNQIAA